MNTPKQLYKPPGVPIEAGTPGHNEHGVPLHACNGYRHDAHYWAWLARKVEPQLWAEAAMSSITDKERSEMTHALRRALYALVTR